MDKNLATSDIKIEQLWRSNIYSMLGILLAKPPDQKVLEQIIRINVSTERAHGSPMAMAYNELINTAKTSTIESIQKQYHQLFIGITGGEITPYASWYLTGFLMEKPLALLRSDLARLGIERQAAVREPEDHAAALCEVMSLLITENSKRQSYIFNTHLAPWIGRFFADMCAADNAGFYRAVGFLGETFFQVEKEYFDMLVTV